MYLRDAMGIHLETGQRFTRPSILFFGIKIVDGLFVYNNASAPKENLSYHPDVEDVLACDWEMVEQKITLTKTEIRIALSQTGLVTYVNPYINELFKQLGFTD